MQPSLSERLFTPIDVASLAIFRIAFGAMMLWETWRYFALDRIHRMYLEPAVLFPYRGFGWIVPWPGDGLYWHFLVLGLLSLMVMLGLFYRASTILLLPTFLYIFLLDQTQYLNHFYLVALLCVLMIFIPAHRALSLDALIWPRRRSDTVPTWSLWILRAQVGIVYVYAGIAKLSPDWLHGQPTRMSLEHDAERVLLWPGAPIGRLLTQEWFVWVSTWGGLLFDLLIVPALLWRRTRLAAFVLCVGSQLVNAWLFDVGIFPWLMIAATTLFFEPDWPREVKLLFAPIWKPKVGSDLREPSDRRKQVTIWLLGTYLVIQLLVPLRHWLFPGDVNWTEEGHRWAWHMKLRSKHGRGVFIVHDPISGTSEVVHPLEHLDERRAAKMLCTPDMILQFAHRLAAQWRAAGYRHVEVRADIRCSLNGRPPQTFVDPEVDLAVERRSLGHADWVLPLVTALER